MKIIVGTDFSPAAEHAARTAAALARRLGDSLVLVRVIEPPTAIYPELSAMAVESMEGPLRKSVEGEMARAAATLRTSGLEVTERVLVGVPEQTLTAQAREEGARLIVLGTHGRRGLARLFVGSVAERTTLEAPCPVLVVREGERTLLDWAEGRRNLHVLVGVDTSVGTEAAVAWVKELRRVAACDVTFVHEYWPPREYTRLGLHGPRDVFQTDPEVASALERDLRKRVGDLPGEGKVSWRVRASWGRPGDALAEDATAEGADLLLLGTHQPHAWQRIKSGSAALAAMRTANVPVLCVPAQAHVTHEEAPVPQLKSVLVVTDFSPLGDSAVAAACALLRGGGVLEVCHVRERKLPSPAYAYEANGEALTAAQRAEIETRLHALVPAEAARLGIQPHVTVVDGGEVAEAILQTARRLGADVICLASHGRSGLKRAILGSVAQAVIAGSERPVYVVRPGK